MLIINIIRGIAVYVFFILSLFLIINYFISKIIKNDFSTLISLILSTIIVFNRITVIWE